MRVVAFVCSQSYKRFSGVNENEISRMVRLAAILFVVIGFLFFLYDGFYSGHCVNHMPEHTQTKVEVKNNLECDILKSTQRLPHANVSYANDLIMWSNGEIGKLRGL